MESPVLERYQTDSLDWEVFPDGFNAYFYNEEGELEWAEVQSGVDPVLENAKLTGGIGWTEGGPVEPERVLASIEDVNWQGEMGGDLIVVYADNGDHSYAYVKVSDEVYSEEEIIGSTIVLNYNDDQWDSEMHFNNGRYVSTHVIDQIYYHDGNRSFGNRPTTQIGSYPTVSIIPEIVVVKQDGAYMDWNKGAGINLYFQFPEKGVYFRWIDHNNWHPMISTPEEFINDNDNDNDNDNEDKLDNEVNKNIEILTGANGNGSDLGYPNWPWDYSHIGQDNYSYIKSFVAQLRRGGEQNVLYEYGGLKDSNYIGYPYEGGYTSIGYHINYRLGDFIDPESFPQELPKYRQQ